MIVRMPGKLKTPLGPASQLKEVNYPIANYWLPSVNKGRCN